MKAEAEPNAGGWPWPLAPSSWRHRDRVRASGLGPAWVQCSAQGPSGCSHPSWRLVLPGAAVPGSVCPAVGALPPLLPATHVSVGGRYWDAVCCAGGWHRTPQDRGEQWCPGREHCPGPRGGAGGGSSGPRPVSKVQDLGRTPGFCAVTSFLSLCPCHLVRVTLTIRTVCHWVFQVVILLALSQHHSGSVPHLGKTQGFVAGTNVCTVFLGVQQSPEHWAPHLQRGGGLLQLTSPLGVVQGRCPFCLFPMLQTLAPFCFECLKRRHALGDPGGGVQGLAHAG